MTDMMLEVKAKFFRGLADTSRLAILDALRDGPHCVSELVAATGLTQSNVSNHLACLRDCGLVASESRGRFVYYSLTDPHIGHLLYDTEAILARAASDVAACPRYRQPNAQKGALHV